MPTDPQQLPDDIAALKAMVLAAHAREASADQQRLALEAEIAAHEAAIAQMNAAKVAGAEKIARLESIVYRRPHAMELQAVTAPATRLL